MPQFRKIAANRIIRYTQKDRINNVIPLGKPETGTYLLESQLIHSMRNYDSAGWEPGGKESNMNYKRILSAK